VAWTDEAVKYGQVNTAWEKGKKNSLARADAKAEAERGGVKWRSFLVDLLLR
jgi:hypothetical protein